MFLEDPSALVLPLSNQSESPSAIPCSTVLAPSCAGEAPPGSEPEIAAPFSPKRSTQHVLGRDVSGPRGQRYLG